MILGSPPGSFAERWLDPTSAPHPWLLAPCELPRAAVELGGSLTFAPVLLARHRVDHGPDGLPPVLVIPGLGGGNGWTKPLRTYLTALGHDVHAPAPGTMKALSGTVVDSLVEQTATLVAAGGQPVSLLGWSVGGCFARRVAHRCPDLVHQVITLGAPLDGHLWYGAEPAAGDELAVPVTAIYSRTDGIFDWRRCVQQPGDHAENLEILSSHLGMSTNPHALSLIGSRLARP
jgi:pimeloyl-ACP methyl ester carboxylesterase